MSDLSRRLASGLIGHAAWAMPPAHRQWIRAMQAELDHIPGRLAGLAFALGCVQASYAQRITMMISLVVMARWTLGGLALAWAGFSALAAALLGAIKANPGVKPTDLGADPGTAETLRFIQAYPGWELGVLALIAAVTAAGALQLVRRRPNALAFLALGVGGATALALLDLRLADPSANRPMNSAADLVAPLLCLIPVWWLSRRASDLKTSP
jgi:hypothetical protein